MLVGPARVARAGINSWTPAVTPTNMNITALSLSPAFPCDKTVFMGTEGHGVFRTTQGDQADPVWLAVNAGIGDPGIMSLSVSPNYGRCDRIGSGDRTVYVGTWGTGIYRSFDGGATWGQLNAGLADHRIRAVAMSPNYAADGLVFAGSDSEGGGCGGTPPTTAGTPSTTACPIPG